jgi:hypothetical protein
MIKFARAFVKSLPLMFCIGVAASGFSALAQSRSNGQGTIPAKADSQLPFGALKGLSGTWAGPVTTDPPNPGLEGMIQVTMRVASRGNVIVHEIAPGGIPEPTVIYLENDHLTLIHYCEAGNRPRLVARNSPDQKAVEFNFADISGSTNPAYLHDFTFKMIDVDHHTEDWTFMLPGDKLLHAHFDLKRTKESATSSTRK